MPREDYDEVDEYEDDADDIEELDDDVEEVDDVDEIDEPADKGRRQLRRGRLSEFSDRLTGGAARPGEQDVKRSPLVMLMAALIIGLTLVGLIFAVMLLSEAEKRAFKAADDKLVEKAFPEAEKRFEAFLEGYPEGEYSEQARIGLHKARIQTYTAKESWSIEDVKAGLHELNEFIRVCRDMEGFKEEHSDISRWAERIARVGALVAEDKRKIEPLQQSLEAVKVMEQFAGPDGVKISVADDLRQLQRKAEQAIRKAEVLDAAMAEINGNLESGDTLAAFESRQALIDSYPVLSDDADVLAVLEKILQKEKEITTRVDVGRDAATEDTEQGVFPAVSLNLRTQKTVDQVSQGRQVFGIGLDTCYGLDSETGEPVWRRRVGANAPFAPMTVEASQPGLLLYNTTINELMLVAQNDGSLIWRQPIDGRPTGSPLIMQQQIYLTTAAGELWKISADTGRIISRVKFGQPVIGPPAEILDSRYLVIAGDQSVVYTLSVSPLECVAVSYIEHRLGTVESPMLAMGGVLLLCDNNTGDQARLRVLGIEESTGKLTVRATDSVDGEVRDACLIRGRDLYVPSTPQRITAFRVNDDPDTEPLARVGSNQLENAMNARMFLLGGAGGQLWMASRALRRFQVRTNTLELDSDTVAQGMHLQPIQLADQNVFVTTNELYSSSVFFTKVDPQKMADLWRTVIGTNIVAAGPSANEESLILAGDFGKMFRVPTAAIEQGGFVIDSVSEFRVPDRLESPIGGLRLQDGRLAAYCGGDEPYMWTITTTGLLEQRWVLPGPPQIAPVSLAAGAVFAVPGRLHMSGVSGQQIADYRAAEGVNRQAGWKALVPLNDTQVLAINSDNDAVRVEYRTNPSPHLFEVSVTRLVQEVEVSPAAAGDLLAVVTADGKLAMLSPVTLETLGEVSLDGIPTQSPLVSGDRVFVEVGRREVRVFSREGTPSETGRFELEGSVLAGAPVQTNDGLFVAVRTDGRVLVLDADGNPSGTTAALGQAVRSGPVIAGSSLVVIGVDGSLYRVESILN
ncbi:MAG: PQQ-binding-like beta-propeller repeat protein [Planctomycetaceae bacterium]|nr:PQQ-binding-like beta-propeller repeat protein [Planctomycetaceae bacterium]